MGEFAGKFSDQPNKKNATESKKINHDGYDLYLDPKKSTGQKIMEMAEVLLPTLKNYLKDVRDDEGNILHQAKLRAIALHVAQNMMRAYTQPDANAGA